ncbi:isoleucine--tRNA ligase, mitochondrial isoform X2 [Tribolium madens]|uniref:isoleucine--tRNA ligase, mitochondrial isoform X2 n=1 Tax=Tribolium madens TaxID=41895 RepID=UPI001CF74106|nr:isoleucine--tRNA ligase, mitochondrial isoform X2 [Tribolium madens]
MILRLILRQKKHINVCYYCTQSEKKKVYSDTIFLPKTKFPLRLENKKLLERDEKITTVAEFDQLYKWQRSYLSEPEFVLHDGPPYANGKLHMGHALNKILKDTILRYQILKGHKVHYIPGWDCHGLPIELKALSKPDATPLEIRSKARNLAKNTIRDQKAVFQTWGITGDWNKHYATYNPDYVKIQFKLFNKLYQKNLIYRDFKPIYWSPSSRTALAEAELEYNDQHKSKSVFVRFKVNQFPNRSEQVYALVWTTTPWTLPANQAVCYSPSLQYCLVKNSKDNSLYIIASDLQASLSKTLNSKFEKVESFSSETLSHLTYIHPIYKDKNVNFVPSSHATASKGTGLVHTAPAHGPEDFLIALNEKMEIENLVNELGCYNTSAGKELEGKFVLEDGTETVLEMIKEDIVFLHDYVHSYPYDWRTKKPVIIRASQQWFLDTDSIKNRAIDLLENVEIIPKVNSQMYKRNLINQIQKRPYWCISRQRKWGVPIPVFFNKSNNDVLISEDLIRHLCMLVDNHGTDFWWQIPTKDLIPEELRAGIKIDQIEKGQDILDIWFDSGISWANALEGDKVADMYLEGVDQFTGWFQSSLLTSVALRDKAPYKTIYVHGFVVDEKGAKMSKSVGNIVDPLDIVRGTKNKKAYGVDTLRWWVACHANQDALAHISNNVLQASADELHKIRSVIRFALGCLYDYQPSNVDYKNLSLLDKYMLHLLYLFHEQTVEAIKDYRFQQICKSVINLLTNPVSALYYNGIKDRLYCDPIDSISRKSSQFVLLQIFEIVTQAIGPIVPHLVEEMFLHLPQKNGKTFFTSTHSKAETYWKNDTVDKVMEVVLNIKKDINKEIGAGTQNTVVKIGLSKKIEKLIETTTIGNIQNELENILQVSEVELNKADIRSDYKLELSKSQRFPCARCRRVQSECENELCERCNHVIKNITKTAVIN